MTVESVKQTISIRLADIVFDEGLYPRVKGHDPEVVQNYARDMPQIEEAGRFISVNSDNILIDGKHRFLAYKKLHDGNLDAEIFAFRYSVVSKSETFALAIELQDKGKALSTEDRIDDAKRLYGFGYPQKDIAARMGVSNATISTWLSRTIKEEKERKKSKAFALWQSCATQEEIADAVDVTHQTVANWETDFAKNSDDEDFANSRDFDPPIYVHQGLASSSTRVPAAVCIAAGLGCCGWRCGRNLKGSCVNTSSPVGFRATSSPRMVRVPAGGGVQVSLLMVQTPSGN